MASTTARAREVIAELDQLEVDMNLTNKWVHGDENMTVLLGGVSTPTIRNLVKNFRLSAQEILDAAEFIQSNYEGLEDIIDANREYAEIADDLMFQVAEWRARDLAEFNAINTELYNRWYAHGIEKIQEANLAAMQAVQDIRSLIDAFDESYAQHRLQIRLLDGTNPTSSSKPVLFIVSGQSNAVGSGEYGAFDRALDCGWQWDWVGVSTPRLKPIQDPAVASSNRGSQWPAFARRFFSLTGRKALIFMFARGGAAVTPAPGYTNENSWADDGYGTLRTTRAEAWNAFVEAGIDYDLGAILWCQGETDAGSIYAGRITASDYKNATLNALNWTRNLVGDSNLPVFNCKIGYNYSGFTANEGVKLAYEQIHKAQDELFDGSNGLYMATAIPPRFAYAWDEFMRGAIHYGIKGYDIVGKAFARAAANYLNLL